MKTQTLRASMMKMTKMACVVALAAVCVQPALAQEVSSKVSLQEAMSGITDLSECEARFVETVAKAQYLDYEGDHYVLVFTNTMMKNGVELDGAEPLMAGPLMAKPASGEVQSLKGLKVCNEPF